VTGLDGSGKSTFLTKIEGSTTKQKTSILRVPDIDSNIFRHNDRIYRQCEFINYLGKRADQEKAPSLKIVAMFSAMILFNDLYQELKKESTIVFCERHPLIDTLIYANVYLNVMHPSHLNLEIAKEIELNFVEELSAIIKNIPISIPKSSKGLFYDLLNFLFKWFSVDANCTYENMQILFPIEKPSLIYFLDAPIEVLIKRLNQRTHREHHETNILLEKMHSIYLNLFSSVKIPYKVIKTINWSEIKLVISDFCRKGYDENHS
jgi:thymidylate kinase